jgi:hypothetical protein
MIPSILIHGLAVAQDGIALGFLTKKLGKHFVWNIMSCHFFKEYYISLHNFLLFFGSSQVLQI